MKQYRFKAEIPADEVEMTLDSTSLMHAMWMFRREHGDIRVKSVNEVEVVGFCHVCGGLVFHDDRYSVADDGVVSHLSHTPESRADEE